MPLLVFFYVFALGGAINNENAVHKVQSLHDVKVAVVQSFHDRKPYDSGSLKNINGNFGNN